MGRFFPFQDPIDRAAIGTMAVLAGLTLALLTGDRWLGNPLGFGGGRPRVQEFSWQDRQIGARDRAFILTFNRPVDRAAVEANLEIEPPLPGRWSWVGRRAAYTLNGPIPYGTEFTLSLEGVREQFGNNPDAPESAPQGREMNPFAARFSSRDRAFAYIGVAGEERGRLLLYNLTRREQQVLTPPGLAVTNFQPYPDGDRILLGAIDTRDGEAADLTPRLYRVATGLGAGPAGDLELILDSQTHQNLQFSLAMGGEAIVVQRASRTDPQDTGLWLLPPGEAPRPLPEGRYGGEFRVTPDGSAAAVARGEGIALISLTEAGNPPDFLPEFGRVLAFAPNGRAAAMVDFNAEDADRRFLQTLVQVTSNGRRQQLLDTEGSILGCEYAPTAPLLYCALTQVETVEVEPKTSDDPRVPPASPENPEANATDTELSEEFPDIGTKASEPFEEQTYIAAIALDSGDTTPIPLPPGARDISFSLSPDGLALLFDRLPSEEPLLQPETETPSWLWLWLPSAGEPEILPLQGRQPQWLP